MWLYSVAGLVFLCLHSSHGECQPNTEEKTASLRLKVDLFCGYDKTVRPVKYHTNRTTVKIVLMPRYLDLDERESKLSLHTWVFMRWKDSHLSWDPNKYEGITVMRTETNLIWAPDLSAYNDRPSEQTYEAGKSGCAVEADGTVHTVFSSLLTGFCKADLYRWPYDTQKCSINLGSRLYMGSEMDFQFFNHSSFDLMRFQNGPQWKLTTMNATRNQIQIGETFLVILHFEFIIQRHSSSLSAAIVAPAIVMAIMVLSCLWLDTRKPDRFILASFAAMLHCLYLQFLAYELPPNGEKSPMIGTEVSFYRDSLCLCAVTLLASVMAYLMATTTSVPAWLQTTSIWIANNQTTQLILYSMHPKSVADPLLEVDVEEGSNLVNRDNLHKLNQGLLLATLVDRVLFILMFLIYAILICDFVL